MQIFSLTCRGYLPPLCAFFGGFVAQEIIKGVTQKYKPVNPSIFMEFSEILPQTEGDKLWTESEAKSVYQEDNLRDRGFNIVVGN